MTAGIRHPEKTNAMKKYVFILLIVLTSCHSGEHKQSILQIRKLSNQAIKAHNIEDLAKYLTDDITITTGNGTIIHGKDSLRNYLSTVFRNNKDLYFIRETTVIKINSTEDRAWETGQWKGLRSASPGQADIGGRYSAMWVKRKNLWKIKSELFVQLY